MKNLLKRIIYISLIIVVTFQMFTINVDAVSEGFIFNYKNISVSMNDDAKKLIKKAGKPKKKTNSKSCTVSGTDYTYKYKNFIIKTYKEDNSDNEYISSIELRTSKVATSEDIKIGSTKNDMIKAYGKNDGEFGVYIYTKGKSILQFELDNDDKVKSIIYIAK